MPDRVYLSNISSPWPIADQVKLLRDRLPDFDMSGAHCDELRARQLRSRNPDHLADRASLVRPSSRRGDHVVHVASLAVLAWRVTDFRHWLQALSERGGSLMAHAEGRLFKLPQDIEAAAAQFPISRTESGRRAGRLVGSQAAAATRNAKSQAAADVIRDRWGVEGHTANALCEEVGYTYHTMRRYLPRWEIAAARRRRNADRAARRATR